MERLEYQPRDYQLEALEDLANGTAERPKILILMGNPDRQQGGKSRIIDALLANKNMDVQVVNVDDLSKLRAREWHAAIFDECKSFDRKDFDRVVIDSGHQLNGMFDVALKPEPAVCDGERTGKRANTRSVGRSRAARAERWR